MYSPDCNAWMFLGYYNSEKIVKYIETCDIRSSLNDMHKHWSEFLFFMEDLEASIDI